MSGGNDLASIVIAFRTTIDDKEKCGEAFEAAIRSIKSARYSPDCTVMELKNLACMYENAIMSYETAKAAFDARRPEIERSIIACHDAVIESEALKIENRELRAKLRLAAARARRSHPYGNTAKRLQIRDQSRKQVQAPLGDGEGDDAQ